MSNVKKAIQLYTMRFDAAKDLFTVLEAVKAAGYDGVEFCGLFGHGVQEVRSRLDGLGLKAVSDHVTLDALAGDLDAMILERKALGCEFITLGFLEEAHRHYSLAFAETVSIVSKAAKACRQAGLPLAYHNHNFEFMNFSGKNGLEMLLDAAPELDVQFDAGWLQIAGQDPVAMLKKYAGRYCSVHLKDYLASDGKTHDFCPIGMGLLATPAVVRAAIDGGARWLIVDQDDDARRTAVEAAKLSARYLQSLGY